MIRWIRKVSSPAIKPKYMSFDPGCSWFQHYWKIVWGFIKEGNLHEARIWLYDLRLAARRFE